MDWILTYFEALKVLENQYEQVDIIGFSAGCVIALYLAQFKYKCKIRNIILCAPYLKSNISVAQYIMFNSFWSYIFNPLVRFFIPFRIKTCTDGFKYSRDTHYEELAQKDFYDITGYIEMENLLMNFKEKRPTQIIADNVVLLYSNDDKIIGDITEQKNIINKIFTNKDIPIIKIPSNSTKLCGHVIFKENPEIIENIFDNIYKYIT